jgi:hypothetical protein
MLFLVNETFCQRNNTITLIFGEPISSSQFNKQESDYASSGKIRQHVYDMGQAGKPLPFSA